MTVLDSYEINDEEKPISHRDVDEKKQEMIIR
jgi:hypothetical protein